MDCTIQNTCLDHWVISLRVIVKGAHIELIFFLLRPYITLKWQKWTFSLMDVLTKIVIETKLYIFRKVRYWTFQKCNCNNNEAVAMSLPHPVCPVHHIYANLRKDFLGQIHRQKQLRPPFLRLRP